MRIFVSVAFSGLSSWMNVSIQQRGASVTQEEWCVVLQTSDSGGPTQ
jgi:hypothetical protein